MPIADLFPRLTLSAMGGFQSETSSSLIERASRFGSIGATLDLPIFDRGCWKTVRLYDVRAQQATLSYQRAVLNALHEVEDALAAYGVDQSRQRYESGLANFIEVLDAERSLQQNQLALVDSSTAVATDPVRLYRALGGGRPAGEHAPAADRS
jgi:outer membrane protein TolC